MAPASKIRPYRVDYFDVPEMQGDKALVRSILVRCPTAKQAKEFVAADGRFIIKAYRFYSKLSAQPKRKTYVAIEKLFPGVKAVQTMEAVEAWRNSIATATAVNVTATISRTIVISAKDEPESGPESPATVAVVKDLNGMMAHDEHEQIFYTFVPTPSIEPILVDSFGNPINDLGNIPTAQDALAEEHDRVMTAVEQGNEPGSIDQICPTCKIGVDDNNDGDCAVCTSPAYQQAQDRTLSMMDYGKPADYNPPPMPACEEVNPLVAIACVVGVGVVVAAVILYFAFCH